MPEAVAAVRAVAAGAPCWHTLGLEDRSEHGRCINCLQEIRRQPPGEKPLYVLAGPLESADVILERAAAREPAYAWALESLPAPD